MRKKIPRPESLAMMRGPLVVAVRVDRVRDDKKACLIENSLLSINEKLGFSLELPRLYMLVEVMTKQVRTATVTGKSAPTLGQRTLEILRPELLRS